MASNKTNTWLWIAALVVLAGAGWAMFRGTSEPAPAAETAQQTAELTPPTAPELLPVERTKRPVMRPFLRRQIDAFGRIGRACGG